MTIQPLTFTYTNWRGETSERCVLPETFRYAATEWHPEPQWLLVAFDLDKGQRRDFAVKDIALAASPALPAQSGAAMREAQIKPLIWIGGSSYPLGLAYLISDYGDQFLAQECNKRTGFGLHATEEAARAACQKHFNDVIRSWLAALSSPAPEGEPTRKPDDATRITIDLRPDADSLRVQAMPDADPAETLDRAIAALQAERAALKGCPMHSAPEGEAAQGVEPKRAKLYAEHCVGYYPDYQAAGECRHCGWLREDHPEFAPPSVKQEEAGR